MAETKYKMPTWECVNCGHRMDFEPTQENMNKHFNMSRAWAVMDAKAFECPTCVSNGFRDKPLERVTDDAKKAVVTVMDADVVDTLVEVDGRILTKDAADGLDSAEEKLAKEENRPAKKKARNEVSQEYKNDLKKRIAADNEKWSKVAE